MITQSGLYLKASSELLWQALQTAKRENFSRIGVDRLFLHLSNQAREAQEVDLVVLCADYQEETAENLIQYYGLEEFEVDEIDEFLSCKTELLAYWKDGETFRYLYRTFD